MSSNSTLLVNAAEKDSVEKHVSNIETTINELEESLTKLKYVKAFLTTKKIEGKSVVEEIFEMEKSNLILDAIAAEMKFAIHTINSDAKVESWYIYHQFQVFIVGLANGLQIRKVRELFSGDCDNCEIEPQEDSCDCEVNRLTHGTRVDSAISAKSLLVMILANFKSTPVTRDRVEAINYALKRVIKNEKEYIECQNGKCVCRQYRNEDYNDDEVEDSCDCNMYYDDAIKRVSVEIFNLFNCLCVDPFFETNLHVVQSAMKNYVPHPQTADQSLKTAFCLSPEEEEKEKARVAAVIKERKEAQERSRLHQLARQKAYIEQQLKQTNDEMRTMKEKKPATAAPASGVAKKKKAKK